LLLTAAEVAEQSDVDKSSYKLLVSGTAAMTDDPEEAEYSSEFFCAASRALA